MSDRLSEQRAGQLPGFSIDMSFSTLPSALIFPWHQAKIGVHLLELFEPFDVSYVSMKRRGRQAKAESGVMPLMVISNFTFSFKGSPVRMIS